MHLELFRRHQGRCALASLQAGDVVGAAVAAAERNHELVADRLERLREEGRLACASGCSHCCTLEVNASLPELARVHAFVEGSFSADERAALRERLESWSPGDRCALLVEGRCSAYEARPMACRGWNSADSEACRLAAESGSASPSIPVHREVRDTALALSESLRDAAAALDLDASAVDLRRALIGLLDGGEELVQAWLRGERLPGNWIDDPPEPPAG